MTAQRPVPTTLECVLDTAKALLTRGAADRRSPCHTPVFASIGLDLRPRARVVVLRAFEAQTRCLRFHTDLRSAKIAELRRDPHAALTFYDPGQKVQIRAEGVASLHHDDAIAASAWTASQAMSRRCYATAPGPGTIIAQGEAFTLPADESEAALGRANFVAVRLRINQLEWLDLASSGHRRARFSWQGDDTLAGVAWLVP